MKTKTPYFRSLVAWLLRKSTAPAAAATLWLVGCTSPPSEYDASGTFEAVETIVSAEATGTIRAFHLQEGQTLQAGESVGYIDSVQLYLRKKQLQAQIRALLGKKPDIPTQLAALQEQVRHARREQQRLVNLVKADAATPKQRDEATAQVAILQQQVAGQRSALGTSAAGLTGETEPLRIQIDQLNDQLARCRIVNAVTGTVLAKYAEENEMAVLGKPLYKVADLSTITLRAYLTGDQLAALKLNQAVTVLVDDGAGDYRKYGGKLEWISSTAEFTPKTIQTKDERANLVYAAKIRVKNDGYLKMGMYGEVKF
jgi:HlyD family secretion protein